MYHKRYVSGTQKCSTCGQDLGSNLSGCIESLVYNGSQTRGFPPDQNCNWTITFKYTYVHSMKFVAKKGSNARLASHLISFPRTRLINSLK